MVFKEQDLTPEKIVRELDKYIVGQTDAKRAMAMALRNRWRRQQVSEELRDEIHPKNILMIGPTGVGKTEIAKRMARLVNAPFIKVEATKYTEIGYVGKDVESMVRELVENSVSMFKKAEKDRVAKKAKQNAEERLVDILVPPAPPPSTPSHATHEAGTSHVATGEGVLEPTAELPLTTREKFREMLRRGELDTRDVELETKTDSQPVLEVLAFPGMEEMDLHLRDMIGNMMPKKKRQKKMRVKDALSFLEQEEAQKLIDMDSVVPLALEAAEKAGIIFVDEVDKICEAKENYRGGPNVSREGVQRDLLPIVEGCQVKTKYGMVKTDYVLFIAAGAFHSVKPSDLMPELQGRFPIRVELKPLTTDDFYRILTEPQNSLIKQQAALLATEGVEVVFLDEAIRTMSELATYVNEKTEDIGARRLHTILEKVLEDVSFSAPNLNGQKLEITSGYVKDRVQGLTKDEDLSRYIL